MIEISKLTDQDRGRLVKWETGPEGQYYGRRGELGGWDTRRLIVAEEQAKGGRRNVYVDPQDASFVEEPE